MHGADSRASLKRSLTRAGPTPTNISMKSEPGGPGKGGEGKREGGEEGGGKRKKGGRGKGKVSRTGDGVEGYGCLAGRGLGQQGLARAWGSTQEGAFGDLGT
eukprot:evm.model.NODE_38740_length_28279_cov_52.176350.2